MSTTAPSCSSPSLSPTCAGPPPSCARSTSEPAAATPLRGRVAIANAAIAYEHYRQRFAHERWERLNAAGARTQRPLWASTGTKNPDYSDVLYVETLVADRVINTMPAKQRQGRLEGEEVRSEVDAEDRVPVFHRCALQTHPLPIPMLRTRPSSPPNSAAAHSTVRPQASGSAASAMKACAGTPSEEARSAVACAAIASTSLIATAAP